MSGPIVLVGSGEFTPAMLDIDRDLLAATGRERPRVAIVATASWPDGEAVFRRWIEQGTEHFGALGAEVEGVELRTRADAFDDACCQAIGEADVVYLSGGRPEYLLDTLVFTPAGDAVVEVHQRAGVLAGCSAGAMILASHVPRVRGRRFVRVPVGWRRALGVVDGATILPHYDAMPEPFAAAFVMLAPRDGAVLGIDEETAIVGRDGVWQVRGRGRATIWRGRHRSRHREGDIFRIEAPAVEEDAPEA